jgi:cysteine desulfurase
MEFSTLRIKNYIYLDHQATTPVATEVVARVPEWLEAWGNASSIHQAGRRPKLLLRDARASFAKMIGAEPLEVIFGSGGSEANSLAVIGVFEALRRAQPSRRPHFVTSSVEHPSLKRAMESARARGARVSEVAVDRAGTLDMAGLDELLRQGDVSLVSVMLANNETGHIYPIREIARRARAAGALMHSDCVQGLGKIPLDVKRLELDLASFAGHKFYALKGSGALWARKGIALEPVIYGGGQERRRRGGTENLLAIASLGLMASHAAEVYERGQALASLRDELEERILAEIPGVAITGREGRRLPGASSMAIDGIDGETLLMSLDMRGFAASTGAACSSGSAEPSPALLAMGLSRAEAQSSLRVGLGWGTTAAELDLFVGALRECVARLRSCAGLGLAGELAGKEGACQARLTS